MVGQTPGCFLPIPRYVTQKKGLPREALFAGADEQDRTADLLITNQLLYRLSYIGFFRNRNGDALRCRSIYMKLIFLSRFSFARVLHKKQLFLNIPDRPETSR